MAKYVYGIISTPTDRTFNEVGLGGEELMTIGADNLAMVVSNYDDDGPKTVPGTRKNMLAHQKAIEKVMEEFTVLPMKFGTIARSTDGIINMLQRQGQEFKRTIQFLDGKIELGVKGMWEDMGRIYEELVNGSQEIQQLKAHVAETGQTSGLIEVGKQVEAALVVKKEEEREVILNELKPLAIDVKINNNMAEPMFANLAFLVNVHQEKVFDEVMNELGERFEGRTKFKYVGPLPIYNFIDIHIEPASWEVE